MGVNKHWAFCSLVVLKCSNIDFTPLISFFVAVPVGGISHAASCVSDYGDAIFALALANTSVLLARMSSDTLSTAILSHHSLMPRFIGGLKDALL